MKPATSLSNFRGSPLLLLGGLTLAGWMACVLWPRLLVAFGIGSYGMWYLDSYAVLAAVDAVRAGADPNLPNPLDPLLRNHKYSDWWYALRWLGLTRDYNFVLGSAWVGAFAAAVGWTARPRTLREAVFLAGLMLSPPVLLAVHRANNDLVIFAVLAVVGAAAAGLTWRRQIFAVAALVLATGLKFYPAVAALAFLWVRPARRMPAAFLLAVLAAGLTLAGLWTQLSRGQFELPATLHTMGAPILWRDLGWPHFGALWLGLALIILAAGLLTLGRLTVGLATQGDLAERLPAALGAIVLLACFTAGISYGYRWIFSIWMALWLWRRAADAALPPRQRWTAWFGCGLLFACFWLDGWLCFAVNQLWTGPGMTTEQLDQLQLVWRHWTQPLHWLVIMLLAGWLLEAGLANLRAWLADRALPPQ
jgi:hypothetical protein